MILTVLSLLLLACFICLSCVINHGIPDSYSAFSDIWRNDPPKLNTWSVVTFIVALLMVPPMVDIGDGNAWQFLGFFTPLYLLVVSLTPDWQTDRKQHRIHMVGAMICAVLAFAWLLLIRNHWWVVLICLVLAGVACWRTKTFPRSLVFWGEMVMFASVYTSLIL